MRPLHLVATRHVFAALGAATLGAATFAAAALAPAPAGAQQVPDIAFEEYTLPNGLTVILHEDHSVPLVAVDVWYHVGSGSEQPGRTGFAHLFEHIMFMGSEHVPVGAFDQWLEAAGANNNGSTNTDRTNYYEWMPSNALPLALWLEADRMGWLLPTMDQAKLDLQRDVVKNERRQNYDNVPYGRAFETISAALYPPSHPYHWPTIGSMADLSAASLEDVTSFFRTYYAPNNATLVVAGDFRPDSARAWIERFFGAIPRGPAVPPAAPLPPVTVARDTFLVLEDRVQLPRVYDSWPTVRAFHPDDAALDVLAWILAADKTSRLYRALVYDRQLAQDVNAGQRSGRLAGMFMITATPKPGVAPDSVAAIVRAQLRRLAEQGVDARELERAKHSIRAGFLDGIASVLGKADQLAYYDYFVGTPGYAQEDAARYDAVTAADVQRVAREYLMKPRVVLTVVPQGERDMMVTGGAQ